MCVFLIAVSVSLSGRLLSSRLAALCFTLSSAERWRGRILGGDGQGPNGLVPLRLRGGSDAPQPRKPIR